MIYLRQTGSELFYWFAVRGDLIFVLQLHEVELFGYGELPDNVKFIFTVL